MFKIVISKKKVQKKELFTCPWFYKTHVLKKQGPVPRKLGPVPKKGSFFKARLCSKIRPQWVIFNTKPFLTSDQKDKKKKLCLIWVFKPWFRISHLLDIDPLILHIDSKLQNKKKQNVKIWKANHFNSFHQLLKTKTKKQILYALIWHVNLKIFPNTTKSSLY